MEHEQPAVARKRVNMVRGADDQWAALERIWAQGEQSDPQEDEFAWQILRRALNESRRAVGARLLFPDE
ncbi:MAG TPA: hypothetical protein VFE42_13590 [Chloroflexota bacterium]|nr:hypothetical protein [Chloroflexota bacterium]